MKNIIIISILAVFFLIGSFVFLQHANATIYGDSLVGWWRMDTNDIDGTGTYVYDRSGSGNTGTLSPGTSLCNGKISQCLEFDGVSNKVTIDVTNFPTGSSPRTTSLWFKLANNVSQEMFGYGQNSPGQRWGMYYDADETLYLEIVGNSRSIPWVYDTNWHMFTVVLPADQTNISALEMYLDGVATTTSGGSQTIDTTTGGDGAKIGALPLAPDDLLFTVGKLDDVRVYNRALSAEEVWQLYINGAFVHGFGNLF